MKLLTCFCDLLPGPYVEPGSASDKDVIYKAMGGEYPVANIDSMAQRKSDGQIFEIHIEFSPVGDQRISLENVKEEDVDLINDANSGKIDTPEKLERFTRLIHSGTLIFDSNAWIEGDIVFSAVGIDRSRTPLITGYESELGFEGVWESLEDIKNRSREIAENIFEKLFEEVE